MNKGPRPPTKILPAQPSPRAWAPGKAPGHSARLGAPQAFGQGFRDQGRERLRLPRRELKRLGFAVRCGAVRRGAAADPSLISPPGPWPGPGPGQAPPTANTRHTVNGWLRAVRGCVVPRSPGVPGFFGLMTAYGCNHISRIYIKTVQSKSL